jgi:pimeloyl-ACP methyl ester carboxylesterase
MDRARREGLPVNTGLPAAAPVRSFLLTLVAALALGGSAPGRAEPERGPRSGPASARWASLQEAARVLDRTQRDYTPGDFAAFFPEENAAPGPSFDPATARVLIRRVPEGQTWVLPAKAVPVRFDHGPERVLGFVVPQLPRGDYRAWCEAGTVKGPERALSITPRLLDGSVTRGERGKTAVLTVRLVGRDAVPAEVGGPRHAPFTGRVTLRSERPEIADLSSGQAESLALEGGTASFQVDVKDTGTARFTATAPGFDPVTLTLFSPPAAPLPVVFVPGTAGSELLLPPGEEIDLPGGAKSNIYWVGPGTFLPATLGIGELNRDGSDQGKVHLEPSRTLARVGIPASPLLQKALRAVGVRVKTLVKIPLPFYTPFFAWFRASYGTLADPPPQLLFEAPYDWRKGICEENFQRLDRVVRQALDATGQKKVILVAHSLGGLVCRDYLARGGSERVDALVTVGTAWLGTPKVARALLYGYNLGVELPFTVGSFPVRVEDLPAPTPEEWRRVPLHASLLDLDRLRDVSRNWPGVFQQLPLEPFMERYGEAAGGPSRSVVLGLSPGETTALYRSLNPELYAQTEQWRASRLAGDDYGVTHYLIGGFYRKAYRDDRMAMQMPLPEHLSFSEEWEKRMTKSPRYLDSFVPLDADPAWGDGTIPLLSATAGAQLRGDGAGPDLDRARRLLGARTSVRVLKLGRKFGHAALLNDPGVRRQLDEIYRERNQERLGISPASYDPEAVSEVLVELDTAAEGPADGDGPGTFDGVTATLLGREMPVNARGSRVPGMNLLAGGSSYWQFRSPRMRDPARGLTRRLRQSDLAGGTLRLAKGGRDNWTCSEVKVWIDGRLILQNTGEFSLTRAHPRQEFQLP